jgi:hypothetical protein
MLKFHVIGEYGPQADSAIIRNYLASSPTNAKTMFVAMIKRVYGDGMWNRIGERNIEVFEGWYK